jgi:hypothetical protein
MDAAKNKVMLISVGDGELGLEFFLVQGGIWVVAVDWRFEAWMIDCYDWHGFDRGGWPSRLRPLHQKSLQMVGLVGTHIKRS